MTDSILSIKNLSVAIDKKLILADICFDVPKSKIITLIGPNGSGKSTLARCILGLIKPSSGKISIKDGIKIGYMPQKVLLNSNLPIKVITFLQLETRYKIDKDLFNQIVKEVNIGNILELPLQKISGGELQKVLLARTLLIKPNLLILDEPTQGIDINGQLEFYKLIEKLCKEKGLSILLISHDLHMVMKSTDYVICLNKHICCEGTATYINKQHDFHKLFGHEALTAFSVYEHHHDHTHEKSLDN